MRAEATVSLGALVSNYRLLRARAKEDNPKGEVLCVVKSNAYGHGLLASAKALYQGGARYFAVAKIEEALALKQELPKAEVLVLGKTPPTYAAALSAFGILQSVHSLAYAKDLSLAAEGDIRVHLKIDVGMGRMGFYVGEAKSLSDIYIACGLPHIRLEGVYAHLPEADLPNSTETPIQITKFHGVVRALHGNGVSFCTHLTATAGLLRLGLAGCDMARVGIGLYGISPSPVVSSSALSPVLSLHCPLVQVKTIEKGAKVGYGGHWVAPCRTQIGMIPFGYKDGMPRAAEGGKLLLYGHPVPIVGRVSMDYATLWIGNIPAEEGDRVTIYDKKGKNLLALSTAAHTIPYELLTLLDERIPRIYKR